MALVGVKLETLASEPDALTTRPPPCASFMAVKTRCLHLELSCIDISLFGNWYCTIRLFVRLAVFF